MVIKFLTTAWRRLPVIIRAPVIAFVVLNIGTTAGVLPLWGNMRFLPRVPWAFAVTFLIMTIFWWYFTGGGYPASTRAVRQDVTRLKALPFPIWRSAILPMLFSLITSTSFRLMLPSILPVQAPTIAIDLGAYPFLTVLGILFSLALSAGVAEEVAFRGYLQKPLEDAYGIIPALILTGVAFWFAHSDKVSLSHLPFHLLVSVLLGLSAYITKSLLPAIIGHIAGDALLLPGYAFNKPAFIWSALTARPIWAESSRSTLVQKLELIWEALANSTFSGSGPAHTFAILSWVFMVSGILTFITFVRLARVSRTMVTNQENE